jgi:hypothetical protein
LDKYFTMINLNLIAEDLFNKIRSRYQSVTMGDEDGKVTSDPQLARFIDFEYKSQTEALGQVSISLTETGLVVYYSTEFVSEESDEVKQDWYSFLKELRTFSKKRRLNFEPRDITKSNLDKRDYQFLAQNSGETQMSESKLYGSARKSYQDLGGAKLMVTHSKPINTEIAGGRSMHIESIFIETAEGERFKYPVKHLNGARALGRHIANGGKPHDSFGTHVIEMSQELGKLRKFKTYMGRSGVMAEAMGPVSDRVNERIEKIKKEVMQLQRESYYKDVVENFETRELSEVPEEVKASWVEALTIKSFQEELQDVFPYIYNLVSETQDINPEDFQTEGEQPAESYKVQKGDTIFSIYKRFKNANFQGYGPKDAIEAIMDENPDITDPAMIQPGMVIKMPYFMGSGPDGATRGLPPGGFKAYEAELESSIGAVTKKYDVIESNSVFSSDEGEQAQAIKKLQSLVGDHFPAGIDGMNAIESLSGLIDDPMLTDMFKKVGAKDSDMCVRPLVHKYIKAKNPQLLAKLDFGDMTSSSEPKETEVTVGKDGSMSLDKEEAKEQKTPLGEFILSYFDRETGEFPKGETAVLTSVEKDYGDKYVGPAKQFIERVRQTCEEYVADDSTEEFDRIRALAGL